MTGADSCNCQVRRWRHGPQRRRAFHHHMLPCIIHKTQGHVCCSCLPSTCLHGTLAFIHIGGFGMRSGHPVHRFQAELNIAQNRKLINASSESMSFGPPLTTLYLYQPCAIPLGCTPCVEVSFCCYHTTAFGVPPEIFHMKGAC